MFWTIRETELTDRSPAYSLVGTDNETGLTVLILDCVDADHAERLHRELVECVASLIAEGV